MKNRSTQFVLAAIALTTSNHAQVKIPEAQAVKNLAAFAATYSDQASWEERASLLRKGILAGAALDPLPTRTPSNPVIHSLRKGDGYTVANVYLESIPGLFVTGNLYRPAGESAKKEAKPYAAILCPHGHWEDGRVRRDMQVRCATFARMGAVVFTYDMAGWYESKFQVDHRGDKHTLTYQTWNSMRVLDFLLELDGVDPKRVAVTGASGGGTQTFLLAALDPRVTVSVPAVMVSAHFYGGCNCESGRRIHRREEFQTNNAEIAALAAPRPQLLVSCGGDWTKNTPEVEFPYIRSVYALYGKADRVENAHFPAEVHDYGETKRQPVYAFLGRHLGLDLAAVKKTSEGGVDESFVRVFRQADLKCFDADHPVPAHALRGKEALREAFAALQDQPAKAAPRSKRRRKGD